ncbi:MAG: T9SS type A sorting domain-containing protein [Cyclobacteriaceae bacterium]|nr:T9SS type A sorting domain-containing protein [Cyclobacteriaceae bacterium]
MRIYFLLIFVFATLSLQGVTCTTTSTTTWDCGTPGGNDDLIVNHSITITGNFVLANGSITVNAPNILTITGNLILGSSSTTFVASGAGINVGGNFENNNNSNNVQILGALVIAGNFTNGTGSGMGAVIDFGATGSVAYGGTCSNPGTVMNDTDSFTGCDNLILPVELVNFRGTATPDGNLLQWETASERNNDFFEVQRSTNGTSWEAITMVQGNGDSDQFISYRYLDRNPLPGRNFYRLRQVDFDGVFEYSYIISVVTGDIPQLQVQAFYPNPTAQYLTLSYLTDNEFPLEYQVYDQFGRLVHSHSLRSSFGFNQVTLDFHMLTKGTYLIKLRNQELTNHIRFIKLL